MITWKTSHSTIGYGTTTTVSIIKKVCITTNVPYTKPKSNLNHRPNSNHNPTTKHNIQLNTVT